jgi:hypothetical protein
MSAYSEDVTLRYVVEHLVDDGWPGKASRDGDSIVVRFPIPDTVTPIFADAFGQWAEELGFDCAWRDADGDIEVSDPFPAGVPLLDDADRAILSPHYEPEPDMTPTAPPPERARCGVEAYGRDCLNPAHAHGHIRGLKPVPTIRSNSRCRLAAGHEGAHSNALRDPDETCSWVVS